VERLVKRADAVRVLDLLLAAYPNVELEEPTMALWVGALSHLDADDANAAVRQVIAESDFFPSIAKFREVLAGVTRPHRDESPERWRGITDCPSCSGTGFVQDADGRDWLCRCGTRGSELRLDRALPPGTPDPERFAHIVAEVRDKLRQRGTRGHWHGGPRPVPGVRHRPPPTGIPGSSATTPRTA
jgi:hypothetical protein